MSVDLKTSSGLLLARLEGNPYRIVFIGTRDSISCAKVVLTTQVLTKHMFNLIINGCIVGVLEEKNTIEGRRGALARRTQCLQTTCWW